MNNRFDDSQINSMYAGKEKREVADAPASSYLVLDSADRSTATSATGQGVLVPRTQPFNNFKIQKPQNLLQGGFSSLQLTEIRFPYAIPNVLTGVNDSFGITLVRISDAISTVITIAGNVFYDGDELAIAVTNALNASIVGSAAGTTWLCNYFNGAITITAAAVAANVDFLLYPIDPEYVPGQHADWDPTVLYVTGDLVAYSGNYWICVDGSIQVPDSYPATYYPPIEPTWQRVTSIQSVSGNSLLNVMGFDPLGNWAYLTTVKGVANTPMGRSSLWAPLTYTTYIDFVSNKLTYYQNVTDASTRTNSVGGIVLRLYIDDETSTTPIYNYDNTGTVLGTDYGNAGSFPFVIHRQLKTPKIFKWNPQTAIDTIDLQLFDDRGLPLQVPNEGLPNFQLTFLASEE